MSKLRNISGFPEWLPEQRLAELEVAEAVKRVYELHGFTPIETPAVELVSTLTAKGVVDKEIYGLVRLREEASGTPELGLHFDLTVPFARYVAQHFNDLDFPFRRYQMQKVWRGERPQKGRFREFYQIDADIVARDELPLACDAEVLTVLERAFAAVGLVRYELRLNNRRLLRGLYASLGIPEEKRAQAIAIVDKLDKIGADGVRSELLGELGLAETVVSDLIKSTEISFPASDFPAGLPESAKQDPLFAEGAEELKSILDLVPEQSQAAMVIDLSLARGLDYYTGVVVEVHLPDYPEFGSAGSGGRYDDLASQFTSQKLPGVGVSFGLSRFMELAFSEGLIEGGPKTPSRVLVAVYSEDQRTRCQEVAEVLRSSGVPTEVFARSPKLGKQIDFAAKKGIPYVAFVDPDNNTVEVKDIGSGTQEPIADLGAWGRKLKDLA